MSYLVLILLIVICFIWDYYNFFFYHSSLIFLPIKFDHHFFYCYFFNFGEIFKLIFFLVSSFNIKFVDNWASWLSLSLEFNRLRVWEINLSLGDSPGFAYFFSFSKLMFFLISSFKIYLIRDWAPFFFYFLSIEFFTDFENDLS
jgi:hypothetical protein